MSRRALLLLVAGLIALPARAANYYVKVGGDDTKNGSNNSGQAWATLGRICQVGTAVKAGDTVHVAAGSYTGFICSGLHGASGNPITIVSDTPLGAVIVQSVPGANNSNHCATFIGSSYVNFTDFAFAGCAGNAAIGLGDCADMDLAGHSVDGAPTQVGIAVIGSPGVTVEGCVVAGAPAGIGIVEDQNGVASTVTLSGNRVTQSPNGGLWISGSTGVAVNNLVFRNPGAAIIVAPGATLTAYNNTLFQGSGDGWCIDVQAGAARLVSKDNILMAEGGLGVIEDESTTSGVLVSDHNVVATPALSGFIQKSSSYGASQMDFAEWQVAGNDSASSPSSWFVEFVDAPNDDYHLSPGAAAIGSGLIIAGPPGTPGVDIAGNTRPSGKLDIGAYVFLPGYDAGWSPADAAQAGPDAASPGEDAAQPGLDAAQPGPDAAQPGEDAAQPGEDAGAPGLDAAQPGQDASPPLADAARPAGDAAAVEIDSGLPTAADASAPEIDAALMSPDAEQLAADSAIALPLDASAPDAQRLEADAGSPDAGARGELHDLGGCGCSTSTPLGTAFAAAVLALLPWRRRRS